LEKYKVPKKSNWVTVHAPALSGFKTPGLVESFYYQDRFAELKELFEEIIYFFEEENGIDWKMDLKFKDKLMSKEFYSEQKVGFNNEEKQLLEEMFNSKFSKLEPFLKLGKSADFFNSNGIPYMQMADQDRSAIPIVKGGNYSFLASEVIC